MKKIFITSMWHEGREYAGPRVLADSKEDAETICIIEGLELVGELEMLHHASIDLDMISRDGNTVIH